MNASTLACASSGMTWDGISWVDVQRHVRRLQARIVKATQAGRHNKVKALQWLLTHSFSGKALAVKRVTENKGKSMPENIVVVPGVERCLSRGLSRVDRKTHARF
jgi:RNA-directed DNA polymerase